MKFSKPVLTIPFFLFTVLTTNAQEFSKFKFRKTIELNTAPKGADVKGDVYNFPVAVILNDKNFDFAEANGNGSDIRFSQAKDTGLLSHSIEHWDKAGKSALIWVKVNHIAGNRAAQTIYMHWGDVAAQNASDSKNVFNTREGFVAVWHLNEKGDTTRGAYKDATANMAHGTGVNIAAGTLAVDGQLGKATQFVNAEKRWIKVDGAERKLFDLNNKLTFSIWAMATSFPNRGGYETMFAKGDNSWRLQKVGTSNSIEMCIEEAPGADLCMIGKTKMAVNQWYHFVVVHDYPIVKIYVNGVLDISDKIETNWKTDDHPVGIGNQSQFLNAGRSWDGILDEARVYNVSKDDNWIKLEYENQRTDQRLLSFGNKETKF